MVDILKSVSDDSPGSGETLIYTLTLSVPEDAAGSVTVTDTLPEGLEFVSAPQPTSPPGNVAVVALPTPGPTPPAGNGTQLVWTFPTIQPGTYSLIYTARVPSLTAAGTVYLNTAELTYPQITLPKTAQAAATVQGEFTVKIAVYNEAGEVVKVFPILRFSEPVSDIDLQVDRIINSLSDTIEIVYRGVVIGIWDGNNNQGDPVSNGRYHIKVDSMDLWGSVQSVTQEASVSRNLARTQVTVYNSSGEAVRHLTDSLADLGTLSGSVTLSAQVISPSYNGGANGSVTLVADSGLTAVWDGRADDGSIVTNGQYFLELRTTDGRGGESTVTREVNVLHGDLKVDGPVRVTPNPAGGTFGTSVLFDVNTTAYLTLRVTLYTLAGELLGERIDGTPGAASATWDFSNKKVASGLYLAVVELIDAQGGSQKRVHKVAVLQ